MTEQQRSVPKRLLLADWQVADSSRFLGYWLGVSKPDGSETIHLHECDGSAYIGRAAGWNRSLRGALSALGEEWLSFGLKTKCQARSFRSVVPRKNSSIGGPNTFQSGMGTPYGILVCLARGRLVRPPRPFSPLLGKINGHGLSASAGRNSSSEILRGTRCSARQATECNGCDA